MYIYIGLYIGQYRSIYSSMVLCIGRTLKINDGNAELLKKFRFEEFMTAKVSGPCDPNLCGLRVRKFWPACCVCSRDGFVSSGQIGLFEWKPPHEVDHPRSCRLLTTLKGSRRVDSLKCGLSPPSYRRNLHTWRSAKGLRQKLRSVLLEAVYFLRGF